MKPQHLLQAILAALAITFLQFIFELVTGNFLSVVSLGWILLANLLIAMVLGCYVMLSPYRTYKLLLATSVIFYVIGSFNIIIEAVLFEVVDVTFFINSVLFGIPYSLLVSLIVIRVFGQWEKGVASVQAYLPRKPLSWVGKILQANFLYLFFYIIAGMLVQKFTPGFNEFYEDKLPSLFVFLMTNMFFRGFVFVSIAILIDRSWTGTVLAKSLLVGLVFSVLGGIAPLIPPNEFMPEFIRVAHGFEVGISNFLYGISVLLIVRSREDDKIALNLQSSQPNESYINSLN